VWAVECLNALYTGPLWVTDSWAGSLLTGWLHTASLYPLTGRFRYPCESWASRQKSDVNSRWWETLSDVGRAAVPICTKVVETCSLVLWTRGELKVSYMVDPASSHILPIEWFSVVLDLLAWQFMLPPWWKGDRAVSLRGSKIRNKVSVGEPEEGSLSTNTLASAHTENFDNKLGLLRSLGMSACLPLSIKSRFGTFDYLVDRSIQLSGQQTRFP
jgi:hypothetical protein